MNRFPLLIIAICLFAWGERVVADCPSAWSDNFGVSSSGIPYVYALAVFDDDGDGPNPPLLYAGGEFTQIGGVNISRIATWDGLRWSPVGGGITAENYGGVYGLKVVDEDGPGPGKPTLIVGGYFQAAGDVQVKNLARWDGQQWSALGSGANGVVNAIEEFDDDGDGPDKPAIYVGGYFTIAGEVPAMHIAKYQNGEWYSVGGGVSQSTAVWALAVFDEDGNGPANPSLFAAGDFHTAGSVAARMIAKWDGAAWTAVGSGFSTFVHCLAVHDDDGPGPHPPALYAGGEFTASGTTTLQHVAKWDGTSWSPLGSGANGYVYSLLSFDEDDEGPNFPSLIAGGSFSRVGGLSAQRVAKWSGSTWSATGNLYLEHLPEAYSLAAYRDACCTSEPALFAGGSGASIGYSVARLNDGWWGPVQGGINHDYFNSCSVSSLVCLDVDGDGGDPPALYVGGDFTSAGPADPACLAKRSGNCWQSLPGRITGTVNAITAFDEDGAGPDPPSLFVSGYNLFSNDSSNIPLAGLIKWNGDSWIQGPGYDAPLSFATFDEDGDGPGSPVLYAGGSGHLARWDGTTLSNVYGPSGPIYTMAVFDCDGTGPHPPALYAGGSFSIYQGCRLAELANGEIDDNESQIAGRVAHDYVERLGEWNGECWSSVGGPPMGSYATVRALVVFDPDGTGPILPRLVAAGSFTSIGGVSAANIAQWDGVNWLPLGAGLNGWVYSLSVLDQDGDGPLPPILYAGGSFTSASGIPALNIARWNGSTWFPVGSGVTGTVLSMAVVDDDGSGPLLPALYLGGDFTSAGGISSVRIARWDPQYESPCWVQPPTSHSAVIGHPVQFSAYASCAAVGPTYQWRKNGAALSDGGHLHGAATSMMLIDPVGVEDAGNYDVVATGSCASSVSSLAILTVCAAGPDSDIIADGRVNGSDIRTFVQQVISETPAPGGICSGDYNASGALDAGDVASFVSRLLSN